MPSATVVVVSPDTRSERTYNLSLKVIDVKRKLETVTGIPVSSQKIAVVRSDQDALVFLEEDERPLGFYGVASGMTIKVEDIHPAANMTGLFNDISSVPKFEITKEEYERRTGSVTMSMCRPSHDRLTTRATFCFCYLDTVKAYKERNKMGRFAPPEAATQSPLATVDLPLNARCQISSEDGPNKRGFIRFVGPTVFGKPEGAIWAGIELDEPLGKNDGAVQGERYFSCRPSYGVFVRHEKVQVGDFPPVDILEDEEEI